MRWPRTDRSDVHQQVHRPIVLGALAAVSLMVATRLVAPGRDLAVVADNLGTVVLSVVAALAATRAARSADRPWSLGWGLLAVTTTMWAAANVGWAWYEVVLRQDVPALGALDVLYLPAGVVAAGTVGVFLFHLLPRAQLWRVCFDAALVAASLAYLGVTSVLRDTGVGLAGAQAAVAWLYVASDVVLVTLALVAISRAPRLLWSISMPLGIGLLFVGAADGVWSLAAIVGTDVVIAVCNIGYTLGYAGIGLAAASRRPVADDAVADRAVPWSTRSVLYMPVLVATAHFVVNEARQETNEAVAALVVVALVARVLLAQWDNHSLARVLDARVNERTAQLIASEGRFRSVVSHVSELVLLTSADNEILYVSPGLERMSGYDPDAFRDMTLLDLVHDGDKEEAARIAAEVMATPCAQATIGCRLRLADGTYRDGEVTLENLYDDEVVGALVISVRDVTDRLALERKLREQASRDDLTGLLNRRGLLALVDADLRSGRDVTVLLLDLDGFKSVNDSHGHALGDELLRAVAMRFERTVGVRGSVARLGGDEFVVVVDGDVDEGVAVAADLVGSLAEPVEAGGRTIRCRASIGVADVGETATDRLRNADLAMYEAKGLGGARATVFHAGLLDRLVRRVVLEDELGRAVAERALRLVFQPVVDVATERVLGAEALLRWRRGDEDVSPMELVRVAEEAGFIVGIGRWVLQEACTAAARWQADGPVSIAVNVSARQLTDGDIVADVADALDVSGLDPSLLVLELTETEALAIGPDVLDRLQLLRALGVRISIDDFGTGHSSLGRLRFLPVDEVKIDRSFVSPLDGPSSPAPVVEAVLGIARDLDLEVVAEGVEEPGQLLALRTRGCGKAQGFLFAPGLPLDAFESMLVVGPLSRQVS